MFLLVSGSCVAATWREAPGSELDVALVTIGPGEVYWERFGHNAILIRDRVGSGERFYNYGMFDFGEKSFMLNFVRGLMEYRVEAGDPRADFAWYREEGRSIDVQWLELAPAQRLALREFLDWNVRPENARYRYDYFLANCSTKVRDALDRVLGGALARATQGRSRGFTFRMHALRLMAPDLAIYNGIHAGLAGFTDRPISFWDEMYVPMEVQKHVRDVAVLDDAGASVPLVAREARIAQPRLVPPDELPPDRRLAYFLAGAACAALLLGLARRTHAAARITRMVLLTLAVGVAGAGGVALLGLWLATDHVAAHANENLLLFDPLALLLLPAALTAARRDWRPGRVARAVALAVAALAAFALFAKVLPGFRQQNIEWILLWLPIHATIAVLMQRTAGPASA